MIKFADLQRMIERQVSFKWGDEYRPSTLATTREGSRISRISRLNSGRLGRVLHAQSTSETLFIKLALYHPCVIDIHEEKMMFPVPHQHPLDGHPLAIGADFSYLTGTITIARCIGLVHNQIVVELDDGSTARVPYPYRGDLLLYLTDERRKIYALNWNLKVTPKDFKERNRTKVKTPQQQRKSEVNQALRNELEEQYYASVGIRTLKLTPDDLDRRFVENIDLMFGFHLKKYTVNTDVLSSYSLELQDALKCGIPLSQVAARYSARYGNRDQFIARAYQDIWDRKLLVNLFEPLVINHVLEPQTKDPLDVYKYMFSEAPL